MMFNILVSIFFGLIAIHQSQEGPITSFGRLISEPEATRALLKRLNVCFTTFLGDLTMDGRTANNHEVMEMDAQKLAFADMYKHFEGCVWEELSQEHRKEGQLATNFRGETGRKGKIGVNGDIMVPSLLRLRDGGKDHSYGELPGRLSSVVPGDRRIPSVPFPIGRWYKTATGRPLNSELNTALRNAWLSEGGDLARRFGEFSRSVKGGEISHQKKEIDSHWVMGPVFRNSDQKKRESLQGGLGSRFGK